MNASAHKVVYQDEHELTDVVHSDDSSHRKVLVIDEQAHVLRVLRLNLDRHGYKVAMALSSENALQQVQENQYDVVIITSDLPDMSAQKLCDLIKLKASPGCPLTLVGAADNDGWINSQAFTERLEKPVSLRRIVARLDEAFGDLNN
jgi:PleD family two-component response regulator